MNKDYIGYDEIFLKNRNLNWVGGHMPYNLDLRERASYLRKNMTDSENTLWKELKGGKLGVKVLRQKPIDNYIVDFYISECLLVIEVDGEIHNNQIEYDNIRTDLLEKYNLEVLRFTNDQVLKNLEQVVKEIKNYINSYPPLGKEG